MEKPNSSGHLANKKFGTRSLAVLFISFFVNIKKVHSNIKCISRACDQEATPIVCNQTLILISDVTNWRLERDHVALENVKRTCMGLESCDPSSVCSHGRHGTLFIHYLCEDAKNVLPTTCDGRVYEIQSNYGFIQSPNYPTKLSRYAPCRWRIRPSNDSLVVLSLHDVTTSGPGQKCDGGLIVSGLECGGKRIDHAPRLLCGGDNVTNVVRCGKVDIKLSPSSRVYPLRFWLSFHVLPISQPVSFTASVHTCSGWWIYTMNTVTTEKAIMAAKENYTQLLIILLSVISGLSATLLVVLIIVCIRLRCRLMRISESEPVYSEASPALQAHYDYISSLDSDKPQPQLAEEYFEVADALPFNMRDTPASPAYAEVEQFIDFKKGQWSSVDSSEWGDCQSQYSNVETPGDDSGEPPNTAEPRRTPKKGGKDKIKSSKFSRSPKQKQIILKPSGLSEPKVFIVNLERQGKASCEDSCYEQIEINTNCDNNKVVFCDPKYLSRTPPLERKDRKKLKSRMKVSSNDDISLSPSQSPSHSKKLSRVDQIKEGLLSKHGCKDTPAKKKASSNGDTSNSSPEDPNSTQKSQFTKERLQTSGIVRNGIQKFEQN